jgi:hypothetical protein
MRKYAVFDDFIVPITNNQAERDMHMNRMKGKVVWTFRSEQGVKVFLLLESSPPQPQQSESLLRYFAFIVSRTAGFRGSFRWLFIIICLIKSFGGLL